MENIIESGEIMNEEEQAFDILKNIDKLLKLIYLEANATNDKIDCLYKKIDEIEKQINNG